jgi:TonB-linked SusC/RagA family outer membrane protein
MKKKTLSTFIFLLTFSLGMLAQQMQITGVVTDGIDRSSLIGVGVYVKGESSQTGTLTDTDGKYAIQVRKGDVLVFSYVGMESQEVTVKEKNVINVMMMPNKDLEEVVVIGYGTVKKSDLTGSVGTLNIQDIAKTNPVSINQALQGRIAGVNVMQMDGAPGSSISIQIRGANSFASDTEPLFVIDGVPFESSGSPSGGSGRAVNPLSFINVQDIESLEVLKDASATAIYGSRGANGVIIITTKKGKKGRDRIEVSANFTTSYLNDRVKFLDGHDYAVYTNERQRNHYIYDGVEYYTPVFDGAWSYDRTKGYYVYNPAPQDFLDGYMNGGTDWTEVITQKAITQEYTINYSGADDKGDHYVSGSLLDQEGIIFGSGYQRATLRMNLNRQVRDNIRAGSMLLFTNSRTDFAVADWVNADVFRDALYYPPTESIFDPVTMDINDEDFYYATNPYVAVRQLNDNTTGKNVHLSSYLSIDFLKDFQFKQTFGYGYNYSERQAYYSRQTRAGYSSKGVGSQSDYWNYNMSSESLLTYNKTLRDIHRFNVIGAFTFEEFNYGNKGMSASEFPNDFLAMYNMGTSMDPNTKSLWSGRGRSRIFSYLGRINYVLKDKYLLTFSARADGSSKFANGNKWADFYSFALAWRASEEPFIKKLNLFSTLKPRFSFGETGNQSINNYQTIELLINQNAALDGIVLPGYSEAVWKGPVNLDLVWETTAQYNVGLDLGVFDNRFLLTFDAYHKKTRDLLQDIALPPSSGFDQMKDNYGFVLNRGLEFSLQAQVLDKTRLKWDINANIFWNRNEIGGLLGDQFAQRLFVGVEQVYVHRNGYPIGTIWGYKSDGFYDNEAEVRANPANANKTYKEILALIGEEKIKNTDNDPSSISITDKTIIGNVNPDYQFGITNNFQWKNLSLSFFFQGNIGGNILNANLLQNVDMLGWGNIPQFAFDHRWTETNPKEAQFPKPNEGYGRTTLFTDRFIEDATYVRLKNVNIGYSIPNPCKYISNIHIYANASNLLTFTNYRWFDPDVNSFGGDVTRRGVDMSAYPTATTFSAGLKVSF